MKFLFPEFLWALGVLAIPIIIHLFNFRRFKRVIFPNLRFLEEVQLKTRNRQQLKKILVLLSRLLALSFLVFAFAQPFIPGEDQSRSLAGNVLSVYIDNSFSMNGESEEGELLEAAKNRARNLAAAYGETDKFQLLTNDFESRHQRAVSRDVFLQWIDEIRLTPVVRNLSEVLERQKELLKRSENNGYNPMAFQISDFQKSTANLPEFVPDSSISLYLIPLNSNSSENLAIDSLWVETPYIRAGEPANLQIRLVNYGTSDVENGTLTLKIEGVQKGLAAFDCAAGTRKLVSLPFTPEQEGWNRASISLTDYPITFDDELFFSFEVRNKSRVLLIGDSSSEASTAVRAIYRTDPYFEPMQSDAGGLDYRSFPTYDLIVLNGVEEPSSGLSSELAAYADKGGTLVLIPGKENTEGFNALCGMLGVPGLSTTLSGNKEINRINLDHPLFRPVIEKLDERIPRPALKKWYGRLPASENIYDRLLSTSDGDEILTLHTTGQGRVFLFSLPLDAEWSGITRNFIFPVCMLQAGLSAENGRMLYRSLGDRTPIPLKVNQREEEGVFELSGESGSWIPELIWQNNTSSMITGNTVTQSGIYTLRRKGEDQVLQLIALNYDRRESNTECLEADALLTELAPGVKAQLVSGSAETLGKQVKELDAGTSLWKLAVLLALLFLLIEILLLRFLKSS